jgi:hypothetical protein
MKKIFVTLLCAMCFSFFTKAQEYNHSIGVTAGMLNGISYKGFVTEHFAVQTDLGIGINYAPIGLGYVMNCWDFRVNPNMIFQGNIINGGTGTLAFAGGFGFSIGEVNDYYYNSLIGGRFGINALLGIEYISYQSPITLGFDFRPGYGLFFDDYMLYHAFDWGLNISLRYKF